jgi:hypothetical protein
MAAGRVSVPFSFKVNFDSAESAVAKAKSAVASGGGRFSGDVSGGTFSGSGVEGCYRVISDTEAEVTILKKPVFLPESLVKSEARKFFC